METPYDGSSSGAADLYAQTRGPALRPAWDLLQKLSLQRGERVLLLPARDGRLLQVLASFHREGAITALEFHPLLARRARALMEESPGASMVEVLEAPPELVPLPGGQDALVCHCHLPAFFDHGGFARAVRRNLRPGGRFAVQVPMEGFCEPLEEALLDTLASRKDLPDPEEIPAPLDPEEIYEDFRESGFRSLEKTEKLYLERFATAMEAADILFAGGGWAGLEELTPAQKEETAREVRLRLVKRLRKDQEVELPFRRLLLFGKR